MLAILYNLVKYILLLVLPFILLIRGAVFYIFIINYLLLVLLLRGGTDGLMFGIIPNLFTRKNSRSCWRIEDASKALDGCYFCGGWLLYLRPVFLLQPEC